MVRQTLLIFMWGSLYRKVKDNQVYISVENMKQMIPMSMFTNVKDND